MTDEGQQLCEGEIFCRHCGQRFWGQWDEDGSCPLCGEGGSADSGAASKASVPSPEDVEKVRRTVRRYSLVLTWVAVLYSLFVFSWVGLFSLRVGSVLAVGKQTDVLVAITAAVCVWLVAATARLGKHCLAGWLMALGGGVCGAVGLKASQYFIRRSMPELDVEPAFWIAIFFAFLGGVFIVGGLNLQKAGSLLKQSRD